MLNRVYPRRTALPVLLTLAHAFAVAAAHATDTPSPAQAEAAIRAQVQRLLDTVPAVDAARIRENLPALHVRGVTGCIPALGEDARTFVCLLDWRRGHAPELGYSASPLPFRRETDGWSLVVGDDGTPRDLDPACPDYPEAQRLLRAAKRAQSYEVTGSVDDREGWFSDRYGITQDQTGPMRVVCRYDVKSLLNDDALYLGYAWYENGRYLIDRWEGPW